MKTFVCLFAIIAVARAGVLLGLDHGADGGHGGYGHGQAYGQDLGSFGGHDHGYGGQEQQVQLVHVQQSAGHVQAPVHHHVVEAQVQHQHVVEAPVHHHHEAPQVVKVIHEQSSVQHHVAPVQAAPQIVKVIHQEAPAHHHVDAGFGAGAGYGAAGYGSAGYGSAGFGSAGYGSAGFGAGGYSAGYGAGHGAAPQIVKIIHEEAPAHHHHQEVQHIKLIHEHHAAPAPATSHVKIVKIVEEQGHGHQAPAGNGWW